MVKYLRHGENQEMQMFSIFKKKDTAVLPKKGDYVVVFHYWFVHSLGWETFTFTGLTYDEVLTKTMMIKERKENNFCRCSYKIIEVDIG